MPSTLGYWQIRGYCQGIRFLLMYAEEEFEECLYHAGPGREYNKDGWLNEKFTLGLEFPNLPYYMDGKVKLSQSHTILRYVARKYNLAGETPEEMLRVDLMEEEIKDFRGAFTDACYRPDWEEQKGSYMEKAKLKLPQFENFLGDRPWFAGEKVTFVDLTFYDYLDMHLVLDPTCLDSHPKLKAFLKRVENIPQIQKYMKSDRFISYPLWSRHAFFGNQKD